MSQKGFSLVEGLLVLLVVSAVGFGGWYVWGHNQNDDSRDNAQARINSYENCAAAGNPIAESFPEQCRAPDGQTFTGQADSSTEPSDGQKYNSKLYPSVSFVVPAGWSVKEPENYFEIEGAPGWANGLIEVSDDDTTLNLEMITVFVAGAEAYICERYDDLDKVGSVYRFTYNGEIPSANRTDRSLTLTESKVIYQNGFSQQDSMWEKVISSEQLVLKNQSPNYCYTDVYFDSLGVYNSLLKKSDYEDQGYGYVEADEVQAWMLANVAGDISEEKLLMTDMIILSLSEPDR